MWLSLPFSSLQVASINKFDSKSSLGLADGVKSLHVLPFFATFASLATRLEDLLAGRFHTLEACGCPHCPGGT